MPWQCYTFRLVPSETLRPSNSNRACTRVADESYRFTGRHLSVYDRSKAEAHAVTERFIARGLRLVIAQPGLVYGPGDTSSVGTMFRRFLAGRLPPLPRGTAFAWAHVADVARGHILALERGRPGRNYFLAGPVHTLTDAIRLAESIVGIRGPRRTIPASVLRAASVLMGLVGRIVPLAPEYTAEGLRVLAGVTYLGSNGRARLELGWTPRPLAEGLRQTLAALQSL